MQPNRSIDLFKIGGIQIAIDYSWVVIFLLVLWSLSAGYFPLAYPGYGWARYWIVGLVATILFFASVLIHELSHSLVGNRLGQNVRRITLFIFGGMAHLSREPSDPMVEVRIAAAGPITSLLLGGIFWLIQLLVHGVATVPLWTAMLRYLAYVNVALAIFNLLPGFPLDGGRLLRGFLWRRSGDLRAATAQAADWGAGIAFGLMALGVLEIFSGALVGGLWLIFIGMFLRGAARASYYGVVIEHALRGATVRDLMITDPIVVPGKMSVEQAIEGQFLHYGFGGFPVGHDDEIEGLVSLSELKHCPRNERAVRTVRDIMRPAADALKIPANASIADALRNMVASDSSRLLVTDGNRVVGLITRSTITRFIQLKTELEEGAP